MCVSILFFWKCWLKSGMSPYVHMRVNVFGIMCDGNSVQVHVHVHLDNSGSDSRNLIGQLQVHVSKRGRNLERDSKCQWGGF